MPKIESEFQLIDWIRSKKCDSGEQVVTGIGDDMAVLKLGSETLLITTDTLLDSVHFQSQKMSLEDVGYKVMACSLSDCAAMASMPLAAVVAVSLPNDINTESIELLQAGLQKCAEQFDCPIVGGDTTSWDQPLALTVTMLSQTEGRDPILRSGAVAGDAIMVTGELGGSLESGKHLRFTPRLAEAQMLREQVDLHAMIDVSDGLSADLDHICAESKLAAILDVVGIPLSNSARQKNNSLEAALGDGEDFELLFCVSPADADKLLSLWKEISKVRLSNIGQMIETDMEIVDGSSRIYARQLSGQIQPLQPTGWEHFKS